LSPVKVISGLLGSSAFSVAMSRPQSAQKIARFANVLDAFAKKPTKKLGETAAREAQIFSESMARELGIKIPANDILPMLQGPRNAAADTNEPQNGPLELRVKPSNR
jgi:hypothetical protein